MCHIRSTAVGGVLACSGGPTRIPNRKLQTLNPRLESRGGAAAAGGGGGGPAKVDPPAPPFQTSRVLVLVQITTGHVQATTMSRPKPEAKSRGGAAAAGGGGCGPAKVDLPELHFKASRVLALVQITTGHVPKRVQATTMSRPKPEAKSRGGEAAVGGGGGGPAKVDPPEHAGTGVPRS